MIGSAAKLAVVFGVAAALCTPVAGPVPVAVADPDTCASDDPLDRLVCGSEQLKEAWEHGDGSGGGHDYSWLFLVVGGGAVLVVLYGLHVSRQQHIAQGRALLEAKWRATQPEPVALPDPWAHLRGTGAPLPDPPAAPPSPEWPGCTDEEALAAHKAHEAAAGWNPPADSALAAITTVDGLATPAQTAVAKLASDLGWGGWETVDGERTWKPWIEVDGVTAVGDVDATVHIAVRHATVTTETVEKHLPALLQALRVRHGQVSRDVAGGGLNLTVTNRPEGFSGDTTGAGDDLAGW